MTAQLCRIMALFTFCLLAASAHERPNILFIMSDDHAAPALSAYDSKLTQTPNLDRLAEEGMRFDAAFVTNSICTPSRAVILSGQHSHRTGVLGLADQLPRAQHTLSLLMQRAGYHTGMIGKWHLKVEPEGFDHYAVLPGQGKYYNPDIRHKGEWPESRAYDGYVTEVITDLALDYLKQRQKDKPFFLMYHHKAPHDAFVPKNEHRGLFADPAAEPPTLFEDLTGRRALMDVTQKVGLKHLAYGAPGWPQEDHRWGYSTEEVAAWAKELAGLGSRELKHAQYQIYMRRYLQCVYSIDENVGRVLNYLDREGLAENTVVVYTSDQGFFLGEHGLFDKRFMYEPSLKIPLLVRWPGHVPAGSSSKELVQNLDFAPTILDLAGVNIPSGMQGASFREIAMGKEPLKWRDSIYYRYWMNRAHFNVPAHMGVRTARYKLIYFYDSDRGADGKSRVKGSRSPGIEPYWEFYDLEKDPHETRNALNVAYYRDTVENMGRELEQLRKHYGDDQDGIDVMAELAKALR